MKNHMISAILLTLVSLGWMGQADAAVYNESGGLVIMEAENTESPLGLWQEQSALANYTGDGYLQFLGNDYTHGPVDSPLEYTFKINQAGLYSLHLHAAKTNIVEGAEVRRDVANDCYVRVDGDYNAGPGPYTSPGNNASLAQLTTDTKYYTYTEQATDKWKWENGIGNGEGSLDPTSGGKRIAVYDFKAGETYTLVVSGRSKFFRLNRVMFRHESVLASSAQSLSRPESEIIVNATESYTYDARTEFPSYEDGDVPYYQDNGNDCLGIRANIVEYRDRFATASRTFDGVTGTYDVIITALRELDGECVYRFVVNGSIVGEVKNSETTVDYAPQKHVLRNIAIPAGATIAVESKTDTNGKIPEGNEGGTAWARGRWRTLDLIPSQLSLINPPAGRIALVSDGNSPDPDDIGAKAVALGILQRAGLADRLVHVSHSCDLDPFANPGNQVIDVPNELRRQAKLYDLTNEGINFFGPFTNVLDHYNCRSNETAAVVDLTSAIDASTPEDPLWIIEAGEPDIIGFALSNAVPANRQYVHVISHHPANDNSGDFVTWAEILAYGVTEHQIGDQNVGLKTSTNAWDWAYNHGDPSISWIYDQLRYAEQDGVVTFQTDKFDCSDAGIMYWWITGADNGGNSNSTPVEMQEILLQDYYAPPPSSEVTMVSLGSPQDWTDGAAWSDGLSAHSDAVYTIPATGNLRSPTGTSTFPGDTLVVEAGGKFQVRAKQELGEVTVVSNLVATAGTSSSFVNLSAGTGNNTTNHLAGNLTNDGFTKLVGYGNATGPRNFRVSSVISGDGTLHSTGTLAFPHTCLIDNAANTFAGTWESNIGTLVFENAGAVGAADIDVLDDGQLKIMGDWNTFANLTVADTATASVDFGTYNWSVTSLTIGSSVVPAGASYTVEELNVIGANALFVGSGTITVGPPPPPPQPEIVAGWDTWSSGTAPAVSVLAPDFTASAVTATDDKSWGTSDSRGASNDGTWGTHAGPPSASVNVAAGECLTMQNASLGGSLTFTISNNGTSDVELGEFHFDAYAFRPKAPRTYSLTVLAGGGISAGNVFTSASGAITSVGGANSNSAHDDIDISLTGLADHTLSAGQSVQFQLAFADGVGDGSGGHHLFVDNVAISQVLPPGIPPVVDAGFGRVVTLPLNSVDLTGTASDNVSLLYTVWTQESGPNTAVLTDKTTLAPSMSGLVEGTYVFRLTATDGDFNSAFDEMNVMVVQELTPAIVEAMYNQWTVDLGLTAIEANASLDLDGDGFTNMDEFLSGHDPRNASSAFVVETIQTVDELAEEVLIEWVAQPDRLYRVLQADAPDGEYSVIADGIRYPQNSYTVDVSETDVGFLKVDVRLQ